MTLIHSSTLIDPDVEIGLDTQIGPFCHILSGARLGRGCLVGQNVLVSSGVIVGDNVKIMNNVSLDAGVVLQDQVFIGSSVIFAEHNASRSSVRRRLSSACISIVSKGASVGANATIACGITLGRYSFASEGSVVVRDVPDYALVRGNPARVVGWLCRCGAPLAFITFEEYERAVCPVCGAIFEKHAMLVKCLTETDALSL
jgi:UDP-2-acetamido-3-amino-2,3-dideoxy-glucuronate N-acetyltransferase